MSIYRRPQKIFVLIVICFLPFPCYSDATTIFGLENDTQEKHNIGIILPKKHHSQQIINDKMSISSSASKVQNVITKTNGTQSTNSTDSLNAQRNKSKPSQSKIEATKVSVNEKGQNEISNDSNEKNLPLSEEEKRNRKFPELKPIDVSNNITADKNTSFEVSFLSRSLSHFSSKLYSELVLNDLIKPDKKHKNIAYSPICIHLLFSMIMLGAHGKTKVEMLEVLQIEEEVDHVDIFLKYKELISFLDKKEKFLSEECIMGTFVDPSLGKVAQNYINTAAKYGNSIYPLDFSKGAETVRGQVDEWIKEKSNYKIESINSKLNITETKKPHMDGYAASLFTPIKLSSFSNTQIQKIWKADTKILGMNLLDVNISMIESKIHDLRIVHAKQFRSLIIEIPTTQSGTNLIIFLPFNSSLAIT